MFYLFLAFDVGFYLLAMSKRIILVKLAKKVEKKKDKECSKVATLSTKGVVIREKWPREETVDSSPF